MEITENILSKVITKRPERSHKGNFGRAVLVGGNQQYGGAILMSAEACVYSGAGLTTVITNEKNHAPLHTRLPEAMVVGFDESSLIEEVVRHATVLLIGPGLGLEEKSQHLLKKILQQQQKHQWLILDGSAITLLAEHPLQLNYPQNVVFTPHQMEWQRLSGLSFAEQTQANNQRAQQKLYATLVLKSHRTEIYDGKRLLKNTCGNAGMATGGMGDTLAGMITGFLAQFEQNTDTIAAAVYLHSKIGDVLAEKNYVVLPTQISHLLPVFMKKYQQKED